MDRAERSDEFPVICSRDRVPVAMDAGELAVVVSLLKTAATAVGIVPVLQSLAKRGKLVAFVRFGDFDHGRSIVSGSGCPLIPYWRRPFAKTRLHSLAMLMCPFASMFT